MISGQLAVVEEAGAALVQIVEKAAIDPLEVEQQRERLAHPDVGKDSPARVEDEVGSEFRQSAAKRFFDHAAVAGGGKIVAGAPTRRIALRAHVVKPRLERLEVRIVVAV